MQSRTRLIKGNVSGGKRNSLLCNVLRLGVNPENHFAASARSLRSVGKLQACKARLRTEQHVRSSDRKSNPKEPSASANVDFPEWLWPASRIPLLPFATQAQCNSVIPTVAPITDMSMGKITLFHCAISSAMV